MVWAGRCGLASNVTPQDEGVTNTHHSRLLDSCAGQDRKLMSLDLCQMAAFGSHLLHGRCSPPTAHAPPPLPYTCPTLSTIITHHPRTHAQHATLRITAPWHASPPARTHVRPFSSLAGRCARWPWSQAFILATILFSSSSCTRWMPHLFT